MLTMMSHRRMRTSPVKALPTQYRLTRRISSMLMLGVVTVLTVAIAACGGSGDGGTGPSTTTGTYQLTTVQGKALPYRLYSDVNYSVDVADGSVTLTTDGNFLATLRSEERVENHLSVYSDTATGKWALSGSKVDFTLSDGSHTSATLSNHTMTLVDSSGVTPLTYVYTQK
jgi:hypothetical protein